jgi:regulator of sigma E protease
MHLLLTIVAFVVIFSILILIHEAGHFFAAKRAGVKVEEFGFGLPPRMFGVKRGETLYSFNWIPFGGFVRMLGEDDGSKEGKTSKRSYANQPFRIQAWIVCAGVIMNLLLAFVLLTIGFVVGIEPLIASEDDFLQAIRDEVVHVEPGIVVVDSTSPDLKAGDRIIGFETVESWQQVVAAVEEGGVAPLISMNRADGTGGAEYLAKALIDQSTFAPLYVPRLVYRDSDTSVFHGVMQTGDVILGTGESGEILTADDLSTALQSLSQWSDGSVSFQVYRSSQGEMTVEVQLPVPHPLISYVEANSPADQLGLKAGDEIWNVDGTSVHTAEQVVDLTHAAKTSIEYVVKRSGDTDVTKFTVPLREDGRVGVSLSNPIPYYGNLSLYPSYTTHTLMGTDKVQYGWNSPVVAVEEMWRLGKMTASMFVNVIKQFVTANGVPAGVSGPVGIAQMTGITITEGWAAILRFVALLSLSLGVINILPFPALDGGHFALILLKAISGKKSSYRWESVINLGGFLFLLVFILYITFNDVMNLF